MTGKFNPSDMRSSMQGWTGDFPSVEAVRAHDALELEQIAGSYEAIADRMQHCLDFAEKQIRERKFIPEEEWEKVISPVIEKFKAEYGDEFQENPEAWKAYGREWAALGAQFPQTHLDEKVAVLIALTTRGIQLCPFEPCQKTWNDDVNIYSRRNGRLLVINKGTEHLARVHHFLEKGNEYGVSAEEFYEAFM